MEPAERPWVGGRAWATITSMPTVAAPTGRSDLAATPAVTFLAVPPMRILRVDGTGNPNTAGGPFQEAMAALFPLAYTIKFALKRGRGIDTRVGPPEKRAPIALDRVRRETFDEGQVAQVLHVGPYDAETPTIARLHAAIESCGLRPRGRHHEIYLGDPRRAA